MRKTRGDIEIMLNRKFIAAALATGMMSSTAVTTMAYSVAPRVDTTTTAPTVQHKVKDVYLRQAMHNALKQINTAHIVPSDFALSAQDEAALAQVKIFSLKELLPETHNKITDLSGLSLLKSVETIDVSGTQVEGLSYINHLALTVKSLTHDKTVTGKPKVKDLTPLKRLTQLTSLSMPNQAIYDVSPLSGHKTLKHLNLDNNNLLDLTPISNIAFETISLKNQMTSVIAIKEDYNVSLLNPVNKKIVQGLLFTNIDNGGTYVEETDTINWTAVGNANRSAIKFQSSFKSPAPNFTGTISVDFLDDIKNVTLQNAGALTLEVGSHLNLASGVTATDSLGRDLTKYLSISHNVPVTAEGTVSTVGVYQATYKVIVNGKTYATITRPITVKAKEIPNTPPVITKNNVQLSVRQEFDPLKLVTVSDKEDVTIPVDKIKVTHNVPLTNLNGKQVIASKGDFTFKAIAIDSKGLSTTLEGAIKVTDEVEPLDNQAPQIKVGEVINVKVGDIFEPLKGIEVVDKEDGVIAKDKLVVKHSIPTEKDGDFTVYAKDGRYLMTIEAKDRFGKVATAQVRVEVAKSDEQLENEKEEKDNKAPEIKVEEDDVILEVGDEFDPLEYVTIEDDQDDTEDFVEFEGLPVREEEDEDDKDKILYYVKKAGEYEVEISVEDKFGKKESVEIMVTVEPAEVLGFDKLPEKEEDFKEYVDSIGEEGAKDILEQMEQNLPYYIKAGSTNLHKLTGLDEDLVKYKKIKEGGEEFYLFTIPAIDEKEGVKVPIFELEAGSSNFSDTYGHWAKNSIENLASQGIMIGKSDTRFEPKANLTNEEAMTILNRVLVEQELETKRTRKDVDPLVKAITSRWSYNDVASYFSFIPSDEKLNEISTSKAGTFITREELAQLMKPVIEALGISKGNYNTHFTDSAFIKYADAVTYCASIGLFEGDTKGNFRPDATLSRAEMAKVTERLIALIK